MSARGLTADPLYRRVTEILTRRIADGQWSPGTLLPSETKLGLELGVSPGTVRKALDQMAASSLVARKQGRGTFVSVATREDALFRFFKLVDRNGGNVIPGAEEIWHRREKASAEECRIFKLDSSDFVLKFFRLRCLDGEPVMTDLEILSQKQFPALNVDDVPLPATFYDFFEADHGITVVRIEERLAPVEALGENAKLLKVKRGAPLLEIRRTAFSFDDVPVELRISHVKADNLVYFSELN